MNSIYAIVTHHPGCRKHTPDEAADAWKECGVCAIGWSKLGNLREVPEEDLLVDMTDFLKIEQGDLILAYTKRNRIAYVGDVKSGRYSPNSTNLVGKPEEDGGFGYPNQKAVNWWSEPVDFLRTDFPESIAKQMGRIGKTVIPLDLGRRSFKQMVDLLKTIPSGSASEHLDEDTIKAGIVKYLKRNIDALERGMRITYAEKPISKSERPDFIAEDVKGRQVVIECKGRADVRSLEQLGERYRRFATKNARLFLVAFRIDDECRRLAKRYPNVELREADLRFLPV